MIETARLWGVVFIVCVCMAFTGYFSFGLGYNAGMYRERVRHLMQYVPTPKLSPSSVDDIGNTGLVLPETNIGASKE